MNDANMRAVGSRLFGYDEIRSFMTEKNGKNPIF